MAFEDQVARIPFLGGVLIQTEREKLYRTSEGLRSEYTGGGGLAKALGEQPAGFVEKRRLRWVGRWANREILNGR